jgi:hypothetical protein
MVSQTQAKASPGGLELEEIQIQATKNHLLNLLVMFQALKHPKRKKLISSPKT